MTTSPNALPSILLPPGTEALFRQRLTELARAREDGEQPYDAREVLVLEEAIELGLVPAFEAASWYALHEALYEQKVPEGIDPALWVPFRTWALRAKSLPVGTEIDEFDPAIYAPTGEPYPPGTVFDRDGNAFVHREDA